MNGEAGLWRSLTLRLGIIYVALFLTSTAALFGSAYWFAVYRPTQREGALVRTEIGSLQAIERAGGRQALYHRTTVVLGRGAIVGVGYGGDRNIKKNIETEE